MANLKMLNLFKKVPDLGSFQRFDTQAYSDAQLLFKDFVFHMEQKLSSAEANIIMSAALKQSEMARDIVTAELGRIALQRKGRVDSDKTRLAADGKIVDFKWPGHQVEQSVGIHASEFGARLGYSSVTVTEFKGISRNRGKSGDVYLMTRPTTLVEPGLATYYPNTADMHVFTAHSIDRMVERLWGAHSKNRTQALLALRHLFVSPKAHPATLLGNYTTGEMIEVFNHGDDRLIFIGSMFPLLYPGTQQIMPFFFVKTTLTDSMLDDKHRAVLTRLNLFSSHLEHKEIPPGWWRREFVD